MLFRSYLKRAWPLPPIYLNEDGTNDDTRGGQSSNPGDQWKEEDFINGIEARAADPEEGVTHDKSQFSRQFYPSGNTRANPARGWIYWFNSLLSVLEFCAVYQERNQLGADVVGEIGGVVRGGVARAAVRRRAVPPPRVPCACAHRVRGGWYVKSSTRRGPPVK